MKIWKSLLVLVVVLAGAWGGYTLYQKYFSGNKIDNLSLISAEAAFTFETAQADQTWNELIQQPVWEILSQLPAFENFSTNLVTLDSLTGKSGFVTKILRNNKITLSYHATGVESFELLFTLDLGNKNPLDLIEEVKSSIPQKSRFQSRAYSDQEIWEYFDPENNRKWTITYLNNILLISPSSFLVEDAIRLYLSDNPKSIAALLGDSNPNPDGLGRLILTSKGLSKLLWGMGTKKETPMIQEMATHQQVALMNLYFEENMLVFRGSGILDQKVSLLPSVRANFPAFEKLISNRTLSLTQINVDGIFESQKLENRAFTPKSTVSGEIQARLLDRGFLDNFTGEQYFLELESMGNQENNLALYTRATNPEQIWAYLSEYINDTEGHSKDFYRDQEVLFFPEEEFPAHIFNGKFPGFPQTHIALIGEILVMTNSASGMKMILDDIQSGNTWNRSSAADSKSINPSSGYSKTYFIPDIWSKWTKNANPSWSSFLQKYSAVFKSFPYLTFRINEVGGKKETSLLIPFEAGRAADTKGPPSFVLSPNQKVAFASRLVYGPKAVLNFNDNTEDLLIQDENHMLHLTSSDGETVYSVPLSGPVISDAFQIDFYKNGKIQLLFATSEKIYGIDRLGNSLPGYPLSVGNESITHLNLVDYDNTKDYRYFVSTKAGNLWLIDKTGQKLEGWNPLKLGETLVQAPAHIRVVAKGDYMVAQGKSGNYHLFNRRGEKQPGGPIAFGKEIGTPLLVSSEGKNKGQSIHGITQTGELISASFSGEITYRNQLVKENRDDRFELISDQSGLTYLILIHQFNKTSILDSEEKILFQIPQSGEDLEFNFYDFGANRKILAVTDPVQGFGYLYDLKGVLLTETPLESTGKIQITHRPSTSQYRIRTISGKQLFEYLMPD
ncbi:hypothetical protein [Algoriphagus mannitolivorans]|uniref:hypothetical protein n=1 Tax=Algoriphagus mannitolivorans TaxID=226504 RepID=UPI000405553C|nr:hypothetical protein [Algoriphagus mannitolivorans]